MGHERTWVGLIAVHRRIRQSQADRITSVYDKSGRAGRRFAWRRGSALEPPLLVRAASGAGRRRMAGPGSRYTASFNSLAGRNAIFLLAATATNSPVAGLRAVRAGRSRTCRMPRPLRRILSPLTSCRATTATKPSRTASAAFGRSCASASSAAICFSVIVAGGAALPAPPSSPVQRPFSPAQRPCLAGGVSWCRAAFSRQPSPEPRSSWRQGPVSWRAASRSPGKSFRRGNLLATLRFGQQRPAPHVHNHDQSRWSAFSRVSSNGGVDVVDNCRCIISVGSATPRRTVPLSSCPPSPCSASPPRGPAGGDRKPATLAIRSAGSMITHR